MATMTSSKSASYSAPESVAEARRLQYVAFLHRHPFATDAYELGFSTGIREDYSLQVSQFANVDVPVLMLDNDFRNPDVERYVQRLRRFDPEIAVLGDVYSSQEAREYSALAWELIEEFPQIEIIIVPKCRTAIDIIEEPFILGYAMGYSDICASDFSVPSDWRGRRVHLLGASPPKQYAIIELLTQPTLTRDPPADIVGLDWNGPPRVAYKGEFWSRDGWQRADQLSIRETVRRSLEEIKRYWQSKNVWPQETPVGRYGPAVHEPDEPLFAINGADITSRDDLERAIVVKYNDGRTFAYRNELERAHVEYYEGLVPVADI